MPSMKLTKSAVDSARPDTKAGSGHIAVRKGDKITDLPMHGSKELGTGLVNAIKKQLGLK